MNDNEKRIRAIEARLRDPTLEAPPWSATPGAGVRRGGVNVFLGRVAPDRWDAANADFAAHARDDVPWLVARVRQLEKTLNELAMGNGQPAVRQLCRDAIDRAVDDEEEG